MPRYIVTLEVEVLAGRGLCSPRLWDWDQLVNNETPIDDPDYTPARMLAVAELED